MAVTILTPQGPTIEGAGAELLADLLRELEERIRSRGVPIDLSMREGLPPEQVRRMLQPVGLAAPEEVVAWFGWRNGIRSPLRVGGTAGVLPFAGPIDLKGAIEKYEYFKASGVEVWSYAERWLPLEADPHAISILCAADGSSAALVRKANEDFPLSGDHYGYQVVSLSTVVAWWIEAIDAGITVWNPERLSWQSQTNRLDSVQRASGMFY